MSDSLVGKAQPSRPARVASLPICKDGWRGPGLAAGYVTGETLSVSGGLTMA